jgi:hypothetical protein
LAGFQDFPNVRAVIGFLRLIGVLNAAIWLGGAVFFTVIASPAIHSPEMVTVLQVKAFPYFAPAINQVVLGKFFKFCIVCALVALIQLFIEWLYQGRPARRFGFSILAGLLLLSLIGSNWLQPRLNKLHNNSYAATLPAAERGIAAKSFRTWRVVTISVEILIISGALAHFWRIAFPADTPRFVSSVKFRG